MQLATQRCLIVGAGSVGQVYGYHLAQGGAEVTFYVRPKYVEASRRGFRLYRLGGRGPTAIDFGAFDVISTVEEVAAGDWDQIYLCIPSTGLRGGWLGPFAEASGEATIVSLTPGLEDRRLLLEHWPESRLVSGLITLIAYPAPLPGEDLDPAGTAYWIPPLTPAPFCGPDEAVAAVLAGLGAGRMPVRRDDALLDKAGFATAMLMPVIASLEVHGWRFDAMGDRATLKEASRAVRQACDVVAAHTGQPAPLVARLIGPGAMRLAMFGGPRVVPFDLETYLQVHFSKVGAQTTQMLNTYLELGRTHGVATDALEALAAALNRARQAGAP